VLWVESAEARKQKLTAGPQRVLEQYGLQTVQPLITVEEVNDPSQVAAACRDAVTAWQQRDVQVVLIGNGGQKFTPIGLMQAWNLLRPMVLYGEVKPSELWAFPQGFDRPPLISAYRRHQLDLGQILLASGYQIHNPNSALRLWPATSPLRTAEPYDEDPAYTCQLHADHHAWNNAKPDSEGVVRFAQLPTLLGNNRLDVWCRSLAQLALKGDLQNLSILEQVYNGTANLLRDARVAHSRQGLARPTDTLGDTFERAVQRRVVAWAARRQHLALQSVWGDVKVAQLQRPGEEAAQLDIVLVLKNGVLLHLECKTFALEQKDLDAKLLNLQRAGSQLAQMAICAPLYTQFQGQDWFNGLHRLRRRVETASQFRYLPLTLIGQPDRYQVMGDDGSPAEFVCPSFEEALEHLLAPYLPTTKKVSGSAG
jgi:hypothetical protein